MKNIALLFASLSCCLLLSCNGYKVKNKKTSGSGEIDQDKIEVDLKKDGSGDSSQLYNNAKSVQLNDINKQAQGAKEAGDGLQRISK